MTSVTPAPRLYPPRRLVCAVALIGLALALVAWAALKSNEPASGSWRYVTVVSGSSTPKPALWGPINEPIRLGQRVTGAFTIWGARPSFIDVLRNDAGWAAAVASLVLIPLWFWAWRTKHVFGGRAIGIAWSVVASISVGALAHLTSGGPWELRESTSVALGAAGVALAAAFVVAPPPRRISDH